MLIPRRDLDFQVFEVLDAAALRRLPRYAEHDREVFDGVIDTAYRIATERFAPFAAACDVAEPRIVDGRAWTIPETRAALAAYNEASFTAAAFDAADGGLQLPLLVAKACTAVFSSANVAFHSYAALTAGAANLLVTFGNADQRRRFVRPMLAGRFTGTMCLSEPHAGSSLTDIRCQAVRQADGSYLLTGSKMWISGGDHDLAETIVHLVLAKVPGGPPGVRGISLFVVPRDHVNDDASVGDRQRRAARRPQPQDGLARHDECGALVRRTGALPRGTHRRGTPRPALHVPDDECRATRRRHECRGARATPPTGKRSPMRASGRRAGRSPTRTRPRRRSPSCATATCAGCCSRRSPGSRAASRSCSIAPGSPTSSAARPMTASGRD